MATTLESSIRDVQVFRSGAVVTRSAPLPGAPWPDEVAVDGLPLALDDDSVRVAVVGGAQAALPRPADVRVVLVVPEASAALEPPTEVERREAQTAVATLRARIAWIDEEAQVLDRIELGLAEGEEGKAPPRAPAAAWQGLLAWDDRARRAWSEERARLAKELRAAEERVAKLARREAELRAWRDARGDAVSKRVLVRLRPAASAPAAPTGEVVLRVEYRVPGARWVPTYVLRLARDGKSAVLGVRAHVVQATGEAWERVRLSFSTADLAHEAELPELRSLRIGRRQPEPARKAWRDPPAGTEALFEGLDRAIAALGAPPPPPVPPVFTTPVAPTPPPFQPVVVNELADQLAAPADFDEDDGDDGKRDREKNVSKKSKTMRGQMPAPGAAAPPPPPAPRRAMAMGSAMPAMPPSAPTASMAPPGMPLGGYAGGGRLADKPRPPEPMPEEAVVPGQGLLQYAGLALAKWSEPRGVRGKLRPLTWQDQLAGLEPAQLQTVSRRLDEALRRARAASSVPLPPGTTEVSASSGAFDHRYDAEGLVDVPSDGTLHNVPLFGRSAPVKTTLVAVPREGPLAVRVATLRNPLEAPILAGPAEVYLEDEFLASSSVRTVPLGGDLTVGLGVEEGLKVARNVFFDEETQGLLGGRTALQHRVEIEVASRLASPVEVEVRDRVPVTNEGEKEIEVVDEKATPPWETWTQAETRFVRGGRRWKLTLEPGQSAKLSATYVIRIDSRNELDGGNRRD